MKKEKYTVDIRFTMRTERSPRVLEIAEAFGVGLEEREFVIFNKQEFEIGQGDVVYITGQSGGGKSILLRDLARQMQEKGKTVISLDNMDYEEKPLIDQIGKDTNDAIMLLSTVGISDAHIWCRKPSELSDGQRYRFLLCLAIESEAEVWTADEFLAILDRRSAKVISYSLRKYAKKHGKTLMVATTHQDLIADLAPDLIIDKRYGEKLRVQGGQALQESYGKPMTRDEANELLREWL